MKNFMILKAEICFTDMCDCKIELNKRRTREMSLNGIMA